MTSTTALGDGAATDTAAVVELVRRQPLSQPVDHGSACCRTARQWLAAVHAGSGPTTPLDGLGWIAEMYAWGPSRWPISWCRLVEQDKLDCGAQAAVARDVLGSSEPEVVGVQLLIRAETTDIGHWRYAWQSEDVAAAWLFEGLYYHEAVAMVGADVVVFDPTRNWRVPPDGGTEPGTVAAIRVSGGAEGMRWGPHRLVPDEWSVLGSGRTEFGSVLGDDGAPVGSPPRPG